MVGLASIVAAAFTGIYYISDTPARAALIPVIVGLGSAFTTVILARRLGEVKQELEKVKEHVNGNTTRLLDKIPDADRPAPEDVPHL